MREPEEPAEAQASLAWETDGDLTTVRKLQDLEQGGSLRAGGQLVGMPALPWDTRGTVSKGQVGIGPGAGDRAVGVVSTETGPGDLRVGGFICSLLHHSTFCRPSAVAGTRCRRHHKTHM